MSVQRDFNIFSLNCRGLRDKVKRKGLFTKFRENCYDIILLQEVHITSDESRFWSSQWRGDFFVSSGTSRSCGCITLVRGDSQVGMVEVFNDEKGRVLICKGQINDQEVNIVNIYAPNEDDPGFFESLRRAMDGVGGATWIVGGDFNLTLNEELDRVGGKERNVNARRELVNLMQRLDLIDVWRVRNPGRVVLSWHRINPQKIGSRLDYFLLSQSLINLTKGIEYLSVENTDHMAVLLKLLGTGSNRGPGIWKLNNQLLSLQTFHDAIKDIIGSTLLSENDLQIEEKWELFKYEVAQKARKISKSRTETNRNKLSKLEEEIKQINVALSNDPMNRSLTIEREVKLNDVAEIRAQKARQALYRSKVKWITEGEQNSKYFFSLEKERYNRKVMSILKLSNDTITMDKDIILKEQAKYYANLYEEDTNVKFGLVNSSGVKITAAMKANLDRELSLAECKQAVFELKRDKTPGLDGLSVEFYQAYWEQLGEHLLGLYQRALLNECLNRSARKGCISLIPKKGRDPMLLKNWRPITLLNVDYKILAKIIANRIKLALPQIISGDQTGFMKNRQITTTIRKTIDVLEYCDQYNSPGYVINLDFEKCFDKISYSAILGSLEFFGFGCFIIKLVNLLLTDFWSCTVNNGYTSPYFRVGRSTHQGDPVVPYLFLLCGEVMALSIKQKENIHGISVYDYEQIISQFADDTQLFAENTATIDSYIEVLDTVYLHTGLTVNYEKSSIHCVGGAEQVQIKKDFMWDPNYPVVLGINAGQCGDSVFDEINEKVSKIANKWSGRQLTLLGKILLINTLMGSMYIYKFLVHATPTGNQIRDFYKIIENFLWGKNKRPKINRRILMSPRNKGGAKMVNIEARLQALKISWIFTEDLFIRNWLENIVPRDIGQLFWQCNLKPAEASPLIRTTSLFWHQVIEAWFQFVYVNKIGDRREILNQIIWYNSLIRVNNTPMVNTKLCNAGLLYISDLFDITNSCFWTFEELSVNIPQLQWFEHRQILDAIPRDWKTTLTNETENVAESKDTPYEIIAKKTKKIQFVYNEFITRETPIRKTFEKIASRIGLDPIADMGVYLKAFDNIDRITILVKYRDFQYRLLNNAIHCNTRLFHWNIVDSKECEICNMREIQTVRHLLFDCVKAKAIWLHIEKIFEKCGFDNLDMSYPAIFLNNVHESAVHVANTVVLIVKQTIFAHKCKKEALSIVNVILKIENVCNMEREVAQRKNKLTKHCIKWSPIIDANETD